MILVTGATGTSGTAIVHALLEQFVREHSGAPR